VAVTKTKKNTGRRPATSRKKKSSRKRKSGGCAKKLLLLLVGIIILFVVVFLFRGRIEEKLAGWFYGHETSFVPKEYNFDGALYIGKVRKNVPDGPGIMQLEGGAVLAGTWKNGKKYGIFRESDNRGKSTFTLWENDVCVGLANTPKCLKYRGKTVFQNGMFGIDVSKYQPEYWGAMAICVNDNGTLASDIKVAQWIPIEFVIIKASGGRADIDRQYQYHSEMAEILDIPQGAYHVINTGVDISRQVDVFLQQIEEVKLAFPPILDIEGSTLEIPQATFERWEPKYIEWLELVEQRSGIRPMIYCCHNFYKAYAKGSRLEKYDFWIADYSYREIPETCRLRQISEHGRISGWDAEVDIDVLFNKKNQ